MLDRYLIELEPEVREWLDTLSLKDYAKVEAMADILADQAETSVSRTPGTCRARLASCDSISNAVRYASATGLLRAGGWCS